MDAQEDLLALYDQWRFLSEAEGEAIHAETWTRVNQCQEAKHLLQDRILRTTDAFQTRGGVMARLEVSELVDKLIDLELQNRTRLEVRQQQVRKQQSDLETIERNLRQVHRAYAQPESSHWHSYS